MPAKSKSQQRLFGMVHAYQKGQMKNPPAKIQEVGNEISPDSATHFAATKTKGLPKRVKKAGWWDNFKTTFDSGKLNGHFPAEEGARMLGKQSCSTCGCGKPALNHGKCEGCEKQKQAFDVGFLKAATDNGVEPMLALQLLKTAFDFNNIGGALSAMRENASFQNIAPGAFLGAGLGAAGGAMTSKDHRLRNTLLGAGLGAGVGGAGNLALATNDVHSNAANFLKGNLKGVGKELANTYSPVYNGNEVENVYSQPDNLDKAVTGLSTASKGIKDSSFWKALLGQQPIDPNVANIMSRSHRSEPISSTDQIIGSGSMHAPELNPYLEKILRDNPHLHFRN